MKTLKVKQIMIPLTLSILVAVMLWQRRSEPESYTNPLNFKEEGDERVLHRSKRGIFANRLQTIYQRLGDAEDCCKNQLPKLIPQDALDACQNRQKSSRQKSSPNDNWLSRIRANFLPNAKKTVVNTKKIVRNGRQTTGREPQIVDVRGRLHDGLFTTRNGHRLNGSALDLPKIEQTFLKTNTDAKWKTKIQEALYTCEEPSACASPETILVEKKYWCMKPTILMNCMRIQLSGVRLAEEDFKINDSNYTLLQICERKNTVQCNANAAQLKKTNVFTAHRN